MKKIAYYFDYLFYCTYNFLMKIRKTNDRVDDVVWAFSGLITIPIFSSFFMIWGLLFKNKILDIKPNLKFLSIIAFALAFSSLFVIDKYFTYNSRYKKIINDFGKIPSKKELTIGFIFFSICTGMIGIVALTMFLFMKVTH
jgi:hypothetical protein